MSSSRKKGKNAVLEQLQQMAGRQTGFDYTSLIPSSLTGQDRTIVEKFLRNDELSEAERDRALLVFAQALMAESHYEQGPADGVVVTDVVDAMGEEHIAETAVQKQTSTTVKEEKAHFEPNAESLSEVRQRINVGWMAGPNENVTDYDWKIASYSQRIGCQLYNFVSYPIGGTKRGFWRPSENDFSPPPIDLPDIQLKNHLWETYVNGQISEWIDCDADDERLAQLSEKELAKELNYIAYLGLRSVVIRLKRVKSPRLAKLLNYWLWTKNIGLTFWILIPSSLSKLIGGGNSSENGHSSQKLDLWTVWADFRTACSNFSGMRMIVGIHFSTEIDDEFIEAKYVERWRAEPLFAFLLDSNVFTTSEGGQAALPVAHSLVLRNLWVSDQSRVMIRLSEKEPEQQPTADRLKLLYAQCLRTVLRDASAVNSANAAADPSFLTESGINYMDVLQAPLQPLADNLDSAVYNTFEQDLTKYKRYREAVEAALKDIGETGRRPETAVVYVLGAGRGPLVTMTIEAERNYNEKYRTKKDRLKLDIYVVEKNPNAIVTLRFMNEKCWRSRCTVIESDMRRLPEVVERNSMPQPDIVVSELLGSFGDNELSPECLDGVTSILKPTTINIPHSYTSYAVPVMSLIMHQSMKASGASYYTKGIPGHGREGPVQLDDGTFEQMYPQGKIAANMDQVYVVFLKQHCRLASPKPVFHFSHPNFECKSNERSIQLKFSIDRPADVMGFAGYFEMVLYKEITLSTVPATHSKDMISWFPALLPLRQLLRVDEGDELIFHIDRKVDDNGVWYEWFASLEKPSGEVVKTAVQNENGVSYYMKLYS